MVVDGYYYGLSFIASALLVAWLASPLWAIPLLLAACFFLWFFRDPDRAIPALAAALVSPADGKVTSVGLTGSGSDARLRISIFLSVFDVHVNRCPITGVIRDVRYQKGKFLNAMGAESAIENEQNIVTVEGEGQTVVFKQIAGLLARRIVFNKSVGDHVQRGERVGLIKFGSRVDVLFDTTATPQVKVGDRVKGGASVLALLQGGELVASSADTIAEVGAR